MTKTQYIVEVKERGTVFYRRQANLLTKDITQAGTFSEPIAKKYVQTYKTNGDDARAVPVEAVEEEGR